MLVADPRSNSSIVRSDNSGDNVVKIVPEADA
jgi:hypothetical protein